MKNTFTRLLLIVCAGAFILGSQGCVNGKKLRYFSNVQRDSTSILPSTTFQTVISKNDILHISFSTPDDNTTRYLNAPITSTAGLAGVTLGYLVDDKGEIKVPMLGTIKAEGLTKIQLADLLTRQLSEKKLAKDPMVTVRIINYKITVVGEVGRPGVIPVPNERITLPEAIGQAGDLTVYGRRDNVLLIREKDGQRIYKRFSLNNNELFDKDIYNLQNQDIIYVEPIKERAATTDRTFQIIPVVTSIISLILVAIVQFR